MNWDVSQSTILLRRYSEQLRIHSGGSAKCLIGETYPLTLSDLSSQSRRTINLLLISLLAPLLDFPLELLFEGCFDLPNELIQIRILSVWLRQRPRIAVTIVPIRKFRVIFDNYSQRHIDGYKLCSI